MLTTILAFHQDEAGDWVARLACGHAQHMRHQPPWQERPWVMTAAGRQKKIGTSLDCPVCDQIALPDSAREYKRTPIFTEATLPRALVTDHWTKAGTWGRIVVSEGRVEFHSRGRMRVLGAGDLTIVEPEVPHHITPLGPVRLHLEFWRVAPERG
jgi:tellurite methyltransferase